MGMGGIESVVGSECSNPCPACGGASGATRPTRERDQREAEPLLFGTKDRGNTTPVLAIGEDDEWPSKAPLRAIMLKKGDDRLLLVDYPDSEIHWMEPKY
jgi:hypothetical protein